MGVPTEKSLLDWVTENKIGDDCRNEILFIVRCLGDVGSGNYGIIEVGPVIRVVLDANGPGRDFNFLLILD